MSPTILLCLAAAAADGAPAGAGATARFPTAAALSGGRAGVRPAIRRLVESAAYRLADPTWEVVSGFQLAFPLPGIARLTPEIDGVLVRGADRVLTIDAAAVTLRSIQPLAPQGAFVLAEAEAVARAHAAAGPGLLAGRLSEVRGLAGRRWLTHGRVLRPAWRVRIPTLRLEDLHDVWIDAETGAVLLREPVARFVQPTAARAFVHAPAPSGVDLADLVDLSLEDLLPGDLGDPLRGYHFETYNCCKRYTCTTAPPAGEPCPAASRACAEDNDAAATESKIKAPIDTAQLGLGLGTVWVESVFCTELPKAVSLPAQGSDPDGWFYKPVDKNRGAGNSATATALTSETDPFAEVQAYQASWRYLAHIRAVLGEPGFCLAADSMACDGEGDALDANGAKARVTALPPVRPFHVTTNFLLPYFDLSQVGPQLLGGAGTESTPIVLDDYQRFDNAAFVPALDNGPIQVPPEMEQLVEIFNRPFDSNLYGQGARDFAYDGDIVYHELTHGIIFTLAPGLGGTGYDAWGTSAEAGAINEAIADYLSASFTDSPATGEYGGAGLTGGELGLRNVDNAFACPDVIEGEVHQDSQHFAGALWEIRAAAQAENGAAAVDAFASLVLACITGRTTGGVMSEVAACLLAAMQPDARFLATYPAARTVFRERGIYDADLMLPSCDRLWRLISADGTHGEKSRLFQAGPEDAGLDDFAPSPGQLELELPPGTAAFTLHWVQERGGFAGLGGTPEPLAVLAHADTPIAWSYEGNAGATPVPRTPTGEPIAFDPAAPASLSSLDENGNGSFSLALDVDPCAPRLFYIAFASADAPAVLRELMVEVDGSGAICGAEALSLTGCDCTAGAASGWLLLAVAAGLRALRPRRRRALTR